MANKLFTTVKMTKPKRSLFDLSHEKKLSGNAGKLYPILCEEILPGDKMRFSNELIIKLAPTIAPVFHRINAYVHYFFVPNRLVWDNWQTFITGGATGISEPNFPKISITSANKQYYGKGSLADYLGIPPVPDTFASTLKVNALPFRAYALIYNEFYRDQNLIAEIPIEKTDAQTNDSIAYIYTRAWEKDYFTSALGDTQRGSEVSLPATVNYLKPSLLKRASDDVLPDTAESLQHNNLGELDDYTTHQKLYVDNIEDLTITVNDLRTSVRLQEWLEKNARAGARYVEQILAHFGVMVPDYKIQRPQFLGGSKTPIVISEVLANFGSDTIPQGNMAGHGMGVGVGGSINFRSDEHGYLFGILSILPRSNYSQGLPRKFIKESKFDFAFPEFANLGEQPVYDEELYLNWSDTLTRTTFGYQSRYSEYKHAVSTVHGDFRDNLEFWHWARKFENKPLLNESFITCTPDDRIFAVDDNGATDKFYIYVYNNVKALRPLPFYGTPRL